MTFDVTYCGAVMRGNGVRYEYKNGVFAGSDALVTRQVALTGYYAVSQKGTKGYQTKDGRFIVLSDGWEKIGTVPVAEYSDSAAQALVNKIISNNIKIVQNNLVCARYASKFTENEQAEIRDLQRRADARRDAIISQGLCDHIQTSYPKGYTDLEPYLNALMSGEAIGSVTWATVVLVALIIVGAGTAAYFAYKVFADESEQDVKYSAGLMKILKSKLTEDEYQQLLKETQGIVTKSRIRQAAVYIGRGFKIGLYILAGVAIWQIFKTDND